MFLTWEELPIRRFYSQSLELFRGKYFYRKVNRDPKITASKGFSLRPADSTNIAVFVGIVILLLGSRKHQLIDFTLNPE